MELSWAGLKLLLLFNGGVAVDVKGAAVIVDRSGGDGAEFDLEAAWTGKLSLAAAAQFDDNWKSIF